MSLSKRRVFLATCMRCAQVTTRFTKTLTRCTLLKECTSADPWTSSWGLIWSSESLRQQLTFTKRVLVRDIPSQRWTTWCVPTTNLAPWKMLAASLTLTVVSSTRRICRFRTLLGSWSSSSTNCVTCGSGTWSRWSGGMTCGLMRLSQQPSATMLVHWAVTMSMTTLMSRGCTCPATNAGVSQRISCPQTTRSRQTVPAPTPLSLWSMGSPMARAHLWLSSWSSWLGGGLSPMV